MEKFKVYILIAVVAFSGMVLMGPVALKSVGLWPGSGGSSALPSGGGVSASNMVVEEINPETENNLSKIAPYMQKMVMQNRLPIVEQFAQHVFTNKRLSPAGRDLFTVMLDEWYTTPQVKRPEFINGLDRWTRQYPQSPFAMLAMARQEYEDALALRSAQGKGYQEYQKKTRSAWQRLTQAQQVNPLVPYAYELAAILARHIWEENPQQVQQTLIQTAEEKDIFDKFGVYYRTQQYGYSPQWGGTAEGMINFARQSAQGAPGKSLLPLLVAYAYMDATEGMDSERRREYLAQPAVWKEISGAYDKVIAAYPQSAYWQVEYAKKAYEVGQMKVAAQMLNKAGKTDATYPELYKTAGDMYMSPTTYEMAEKSYQKYAKLRPNDPKAYEKLAWISIERGNDKKAIEYVDQGLGLSPRSCNLYTMRCQAQFHLNQYQLALGDCNNAIKSSGKCVAAFGARADVAEALGQSEQAAKDRKQYRSMIRR